MDCARFETTMIDELYDELDELTSAAAKRHVAGCAKLLGVDRRPPRDAASGGVPARRALRRAWRIASSPR